jgi:hypothetical protein
VVDVLHVLGRLATHRLLLVDVADVVSLRQQNKLPLVLSPSFLASFLKANTPTQDTHRSSTRLFEVCLHVG